MNSTMLWYCVVVVFEEGVESYESEIYYATYVTGESSRPKFNARAGKNGELVTNKRAPFRGIA